MTDFRILTVALGVSGQAVWADPLTELRCAEAAWQQASVALQENRDAVWERMNVWLDWPAQADCAGRAGPDGSLILHCGEADARFQTEVNFQAVDYDRLGRMQALVFMMGLLEAFQTPEMTEAFAQIDEATTQIVDELEEIGLTVTPTEPEPEEEVPERSLSEAMAEINPLQNRLGMTAILTWPDAAEENALARIDDLKRINDMLLSFERGDPSRGNTVAQATAARARLADLITQQAAVWSDAHMPLAASRFQLFDRSMDVVRYEADSVSVVDIASWSQTSDAVGTMIEGVDEVVFFYEPQRGYVESVSDGADCKVLNTFPCPPLNSGAPKQMGALADIPEGCDSADGCTFTTLRWVSEHVAVQTYLQASNVGADDLAQFASRLTTLRTKALLRAFEPDAGFDPTTQCRI